MNTGADLIADPALDPSSILYGHDLHDALAPAQLIALGAEGRTADGRPLYRVVRDPENDWSGIELSQFWSGRDYYDYCHGQRAEPIEFWVTDHGITTWDEAKQSQSLNDPAPAIASAAVIWEDDRRQHYHYGRLHCATGPAWILREHTGIYRRLYYLDGEQYSAAAWNYAIEHQLQYHTQIR